MDMNIRRKFARRFFAVGSFLIPHMFNSHRAMLVHGGELIDKYEDYKNFQVCFSRSITSNDGISTIVWEQRMAIRRVKRLDDIYYSFENRHDPDLKYWKAVEQYDVQWQDPQNEGKMVFLNRAAQRAMIVTGYGQVDKPASVYPIKLPNYNEFPSGYYNQYEYWILKNVLDRLEDIPSNAINYIIGLKNGNIALGTGDGTIQIWDPRTRKMITSFSANDGLIKELKELDNGNIVAASFPNNTRIWDPSKGEVVRELGRVYVRNHPMPRRNKWATTLVAKLPNGYVATPFNQTIRIWNPDTGELVRTLEGGSTRRVYILTPSDETLISISVTGQITSWNVNTGQRIFQRNIHEDPEYKVPEYEEDSHEIASIYHAQLWPNGNIAVFSGYNKVITLDSKDGSIIESVALTHKSFPENHRTNERHPRYWQKSKIPLWRIDSPRILPDGKIVSKNRRKNLQIWDPNLNRIIKKFDRSIHNGKTSIIFDVFVLPNGEIATTYYRDDTVVRIWGPEEVFTKKAR